MIMVYLDRSDRPMDMLNTFSGGFRTVVLACSLLALIARTHAQADDMRYFVGTWDFRIWGPTNTTDRPDLTGTWHLEDGLDSALALVGRVVLDDGDGVQGGLFTRELIAYDAHTRAYTRTIATNTGGHYTFTSSGWKDDGLTWTGSQRSAAGEVALREEIQRRGPDGFDVVFYRKDGDGWMVQSREKLDRRQR